MFFSLSRRVEGGKFPFRNGGKFRLRFSLKFTGELRDGERKTFVFVSCFLFYVLMVYADFGLGFGISENTKTFPSFYERPFCVNGIQESLKFKYDHIVIFRDPIKIQHKRKKIKCTVLLKEIFVEIR